MACSAMAFAKYDPEELRRRLYDRSAVLTRASHALELAADQLREASDLQNFLKSSVDVRSAAMTAMHGALGALELSGEFELAAFIQSVATEEE
ncbi:MAG TPA: hypothetical protein VIV60_16315 [Polyangiaceae bacterium]